MDLSLPIESLNRYLESAGFGFKNLRSAEKFAGGQSNPTYLLEAGSGRYVLRRKPPGQLLKSAHAVDREFRVMRALADSPVPVPTALALCDDDDVIGSMFYVMEHIDGTVHWDATLLDKTNSERTAMYHTVTDALADLHQVDIKAAGLEDFGRPGNYYERQIGRWSKQYRASETETIADMDKLIEWLPKNIPADDGLVSLVHGDFKLDNMLWHNDEPKILAILDWELSTLGHPLADLAYYSMGLRLPPDDGTKGLGGVNRKQLGIPEENEIVDRYCAKANIAGIDNWNFYLIFCFFRLAAIIQGVKKRGLDGNASSPEAIKLGESVAPLSMAATSLI